MAEGALGDRSRAVPWYRATHALASRTADRSPCWQSQQRPPGSGDTWSYEPKWDGFRAIVFRDGDELLIQSRDGKPLDRYFPELAAPLKANLPERCIMDGEVVIAGGERLDFDALLLRIHPAASRVAMLAEAVAGVIRRLGPAGAR